MSPPLDHHTLTRRTFATGCALFPFIVAPGAKSPVAQDASPASKEDIFRYSVGDLNVTVFNTDRSILSAVLGAANASPDQQAAVSDASGPFMMDNAVALVDTGSDVVLLDGGNASLLKNKLAREGYEPQDIDLVTFSHLHFDHVVGTIDVLLQPLFPNARYIVIRAEHDYWMGEDERPISDYAQSLVTGFRSDARMIIEGIGDQIDLVEWDEEFLPGMRMIPAIGHSGGHAAVEITSGNETLLHVGDLIVNPVLHLEHPEWYIAAAVWPDEDLASRRVLMDRAADEHLLIQTVHFPFPGVGYVEKDGDAWRWIPLAQ